MDEKTPHNVIDIMEEQNITQMQEYNARLGPTRFVMYMTVRLLTSSGQADFRTPHPITATSSTTNILRSMKRPACNASA